MKTLYVLILVALVAAAVYVLAPSLPSPFAPPLVDGQSIRVTGTLALVDNPPLSRYVAPVEVWVLRETVYGVPTSRVFYLTQRSDPIMRLSGYSVGESVEAVGTLLIRGDVNLNSVYLIRYSSLGATG
jgi:hypothetical protein